MTGSDYKEMHQISMCVAYFKRSPVQVVRSGTRTTAVQLTCMVSCAVFEYKMLETFVNKTVCDLILLLHVDAVLSSDLSNLHHLVIILEPCIG